MASSLLDLITDSKLEVESFKDYSIQTRLVSNPATGQRRTRQQERWQRIKELGRGSFGTVWLEECTAGPSSGEVRAVKELCKNPTSVSTNYYRELEAIAKFSQERYQDCFVRSFGWYENNNAVFITMEYFELGDLESHLKTPFSHTEARQIIQQLLEGLGFMHDNNFAHRDLKPANVLVLHPRPKWWVKIADFGISKRINGTALRTVVGTEAYLAPEVMGFLTTDSEEANENNFSFAVDIWAIGSITFRVITGQFAFQNLRKLSDYVVRGRPFSIEHLQSMSPECSDFVVKTMAASPRCRPTSQEALYHPWILTHEPTLNELDLHSMIRTNCDSDENKTIPLLASAQWTESSATLGSQNDVLVDKTIKNLSLNNITTKRLETFTLIQELKGHSGNVLALAFSPNGWLASCSYSDKTIRIWAVDAQDRLEQVQELKGRFKVLAFSPNGRWLAAAGHETIRIWAADAQNRLEQAQELKGHGCRVFNLAFSPNGRLASGGYNNKSIRIWAADAQNRLEQVQELRGGGVKALAFSPNGRLASGGYENKTIRIWTADAQNRLEQVQELMGHRSMVSTLAFSPNGRLASGGYNNKTIRIWTADAQNRLEQVQELMGHRGGVQALAFSPNGRWLVSGGYENKTIRIWTADAQNRLEQVQELMGEGRGVRALVFSPNGRRLAAASGETIRIWAIDN